MAEVAQAWEMKFVAPAFNLARTTRDFTITLYQFDGISIHFTCNRDRWKRRIEEAVNQMIAEYKIYSYLEWKQEE